MYRTHTCRWAAAFCEAEEEEKKYLAMIGSRFGDATDGWVAGGEPDR